MAGQETVSVLTDEQKARGQALIIARDILAAKGNGPFASVELGGASTGDLLVLAGWVLEGGATVEWDEQGEEPEPDENEETARGTKVNRAKHLVHTAIVEQFGEGTFASRAAETAIGYLGADGLI